MATTAGALSQVSVGSTTASLSSAAATGGTAPYTYQWYRSTTSGFTPGVGNIIAGATALTLNDTGLIPGTKYYYEVVATDSGSVTGNSAQLGVLTMPPALSPNQFTQSPLLGVLDLRFNTDTVSAQIDASAGTSVFYAGQGVKLVSNALGGIPKVVGCSSKSDACIGFINFDIKTVAFGAGMNCEISMNQNCMYLYATGAITQGAQVCLDPTTVGGVQATGNSATVVGWAFDGAASAGQLIRVMLLTPSFATA